MVLLLGCVSAPGMVGLRPDGSPGPECPKNALKAMELLRLHPGDAAWIDLDMNKIGSNDITANDGPVESALSEPLGNAFETRTRFYGKIWTGGPFVAIRSYEARSLDMGPSIPICAVARLDDDGLRKEARPRSGERDPRALRGAYPHRRWFPVM